ncbi:MAG: SLATT domain-containing protein [Methylococcales bacterium]|nr:SLATT domain-containing protein [Methylococcales bacterium]
MMNDINPVTVSIKELHRRAEMTSNARYHAARRMSLHGWFSQWTLALLAVAQIVITLIIAFKLHSNFNENYLNFGAIFFGVLVLAYSLLLGMADFSSRAVKLHGCGLELGRLTRKLFLFSQSGEATTDDYKRFYTEYYDILDKYENHSRIDYLKAHYKYYDAEASKLIFKSPEWFLKRLHLINVCIKIYCYHALQFSNYVLSISLVSAWIYFATRSTGVGG